MASITNAYYKMKKHHGVNGGASSSPRARASDPRATFDSFASAAVYFEKYGSTSGTPIPSKNSAFHTNAPRPAGKPTSKKSVPKCMSREFGKMLNDPISPSEVYDPSSKNPRERASYPRATFDTFSSAAAHFEKLGSTSGTPSRGNNSAFDRKTQHPAGKPTSKKSDPKCMSREFGKMLNDPTIQPNKVYDPSSNPRERASYPRATFDSFASTAAHFEKLGSLSGTPSRDSNSAFDRKVQHPGKPTSKKSDRKCWKAEPAQPPRQCHSAYDRKAQTPNTMIGSNQQGHTNSYDAVQDYRDGTPGTSSNATNLQSDSQWQAKDSNSGRKSTARRSIIGADGDPKKKTPDSQKSMPSQPAPFGLLQSIANPMGAQSTGGSGKPEDLTSVFVSYYNRDGQCGSRYYSPEFIFNNAPLTGDTEHENPGTKNEERMLWGINKDGSPCKKCQKEQGYCHGHTNQNPDKKNDRIWGVTKAGTPCGNCRSKKG